MKKALFILPALMAFSLSGCSLLSKLLNRNSSNSNGSGNESGQSGQSGNSGQGGQSGQSGGTDVSFDYSALGLSDNVDSSYSKTINGSLEVKFPNGVLCNTKYGEIGLAANALMTMKALNGKKITKIIMDNYKYYNDGPVYASESASGTSVVGNAAGDDGSGHNKVTFANLNNDVYTYKNNHTGNSWTYSVTVTIA